MGPTPVPRAPSGGAHRFKREAVAADDYRVMATLSEATAGETAERLDPHPWRATIWLTLLAIAAGMAWSLWLEPWMRHSPYWLPSEDVWVPIQSAQYVANGALGYLYEATPLFVAPPLIAIVLAPIALIGQTLGMTTDTPFPIPHPTLWLVYGPAGLALTAVLFHAVRSVAVELRIRRPVVLQLVAFALVVDPVAIRSGHFEDVLALAFVLFFVRARLRGQPIHAALMLSVAIAFKQWALLAVPLAIVTAPPGRRVRTTAAACAFPALLMAFPLAVDAKHAVPALLGARSWPWLGHPAPWVSDAHRILVGTPARLGAVLFAVLVAWFVRDRSDGSTLLAGLGLVFLGRIAFEPTLYAYYLAPGAMLLVLHAAPVPRRLVRAVVLSLAALAMFLLHLPRDPWWAIEAGIGVALAWPAGREVFLRTRRRAPVQPDPEPRLLGADVAVAG